MKKLLFSLAAALTAAGALAAEPEYTEVTTAAEFLKAFEELKPAVKVMADITVETTSAILVDTEAILDLNGHTLNTNHVLAHRGYTTFTITDSSEEGTGRIVASDGALSCNTPGNVYLRGGLLTGTENSHQPVVNVGKDGNFYLEGGRIDATRHSQAVENAGNFTINGGTVVGAYMSIPPVLNNGIGVTTFNAGAVYAGNRTTSVCFENAYWTDGEEEEIGKAILPEGAFDGGAIVTDAKWAIPGTNYINYHMPEGTQMQPGNHYYYPGTAFALPECDYNGDYPFAGWATNADKTGVLLTEVSAETAADLELYPVWKYLNINDNVTPDLKPSSVSPEPGTQVEKISEIILSYGEMDLSAYEGEHDFGYIMNMNSGEKVAVLHAPTTDWDGNVTFTADPEVTANGTYQVFIAAGSFGNDDWYYDDYQDGRCNPDLRYTYTIRNAAQGTNDVSSDPVSGTSVNELSKITLTFNDGHDVTYDYDAKGTLTNEKGEQVATIDWQNMEYAYAGENEEIEQIVITLTEAVKTPGTYTLSLPEGMFSYDWGATPVSALSYSWTVGTDAVEAIDAESDAALEIHDLLGRRIEATEISSLPAGLYIINGRKVAVK